MLLLYNNQLMSEQELRLPVTNRAFQYNDGFFETVMVVKGRLRFWRDHMARMQEAAQSLKLDLPPYFLAKEFENSLLDMAKQNDALSYGRLKLKVWRAGSGIYMPQTNTSDWLATVQSAIPAAETALHIGICESIKTVYSPLSHFKGPNAPVYVLASMEKQERKFDDMLLLDHQGHVAELTSSNIFWVMDGVLYTPMLSTGCVNGILRRNIMKCCATEGIPVREVLALPGVIYGAESVFSANVTGTREVKSLDGQPLQATANLLPLIKDILLQQP